MQNLGYYVEYLIFLLIKKLYIFLTLDHYIAPAETFVPFAWPSNKNTYDISETLLKKIFFNIYEQWMGPTWNCNPEWKIELHIV